MKMQERFSHLSLLLLTIFIGLAKAGTADSSLVNSQNFPQDFYATVEVPKRKSSKSIKKSNSFNGGGKNNSWQWPNENSHNFQTIRHLDFGLSSAVKNRKFDQRIAQMKSIEETSTESVMVVKEEQQKAEINTSLNAAAVKSQSSQQNGDGERENPFRTQTEHANRVERRYSERIAFYTNYQHSQKPTKITEKFTQQETASSGKNVESLRNFYEEISSDEGMKSVPDCGNCPVLKSVSDEISKVERETLKERIQNNKKPLNFPKFDRFSPSLNTPRSDNSKPSVSTPRSEELKTQVKVEEPGKITVNQDSFCEETYYVPKIRFQEPKVVTYEDWKVTLY